MLLTPQVPHLWVFLCESGRGFFNEDVGWVVNRPLSLTSTFFCSLQEFILGKVGKNVLRATTLHMPHHISEMAMLPQRRLTGFKRHVITSFMHTRTQDERDGEEHSLHSDIWIAAAAENHFAGAHVDAVCYHPLAAHLMCVHSCSPHTV